MSGRQTRKRFSPKSPLGKQKQQRQIHRNDTELVMLSPDHEKAVEAVDIGRKELAPLGEFKLGKKRDKLASPAIRILKICT